MRGWGRCGRCGLGSDVGRPVHGLLASLRSPGDGSRPVHVMAASLDRPSVKSSYENCPADFTERPTATPDGHMLARPRHMEHPSKVRRPANGQTPSHNEAIRPFAGQLPSHATPPANSDGHIMASPHHLHRDHRSSGISHEHEEAVLRVWVAQYGLRSVWRAWIPCGWDPRRSPYDR